MEKLSVGLPTVRKAVNFDEAKIWDYIDSQFIELAGGYAYSDN
jgi:hypothetical protein